MTVWHINGTFPKYVYFTYFPFVYLKLGSSYFANYLNPDILNLKNYSRDPQGGAARMHQVKIFLHNDIALDGLSVVKE